MVHTHRSATGSVLESCDEVALMGCLSRGNCSSKASAATLVPSLLLYACKVDKATAYSWSYCKSAISFKGIVEIVHTLTPRSSPAQPLAATIKVFNARNNASTSF